LASGKPHESTDLIVDTDAGHAVRDFAFGRSNCFDPPGAVVIPYTKT
jgi:hypothetical protein